MVWALAAVLGIALGVGGGYGGAAWWFRGDRDEMRLGFACSPPLLGSVLAGSGLACLLSNWLASRKARNLPPAESLRMN